MRLVLVFVLVALGAMLVLGDDAFADHSEVVIEPVPGSGFPECQDEGGCYNPMVATVDVGGVVIFSNTDTVQSSLMYPENTPPSPEQKQIN